MLTHISLIFFAYPGYDVIAQTFATVPEMTEEKFSTALRNVSKILRKNLFHIHSYLAQVSKPQNSSTEHADNAQAHYRHQHRTGGIIKLYILRTHYSQALKTIPRIAALSEKLFVLREQKREARLDESATELGLNSLFN